jgi:hypothetical protein
MDARSGVGIPLPSAPVFDRAMKRSIEPHLHAGEELLEALAVQSRRGSSLAAIELASKLGLAITSRRLLVFKAGGSMTLSAKELLSAVALADVDSVEVGKGMLTKPITLTVRGEAVQVEAPKAANVKEFVAAYERAKGAVPA